MRLPSILEQTILIMLFLILFDRIIVGISSEIHILILLGMVVLVSVSIVLLNKAQTKYNNALTFLSHHTIIIASYSIVLIMFGEIVIKILMNFIEINKQSFNLLSLSIAIIILIWSLISGNFIWKKQKTIYSSKIKKPLRIIHLSDLHLHGPFTKRNINKVLRLSEKENPDLITITGDLFDQNGIPSKQMLSEFKKFKTQILYVTGNHEIDYIGRKKTLQLIKYSGIKNISNENIELKGIRITGVEDDVKKKNIEQLMKTKTKKFHLYLIHKPKYFDLVKNKVDLVLAGHTHAGQIFPGKHIVKTLFYKFIHGWYDLGKTKIHVSAGTRGGEIYLRLGTRNEITIIDLKPKSQKNEESNINNLFKR